MERERLAARRAELIQEGENARAVMYRIQGAIALLDEQLAALPEDPKGPTLQALKGGKE